jgi:hypothetical protein
MIRRQYSALIVLGATILSSVTCSASQRRIVSVEEAERLVAAALPAATRRLPKFDVHGGVDENFPQFYFLSATWAGQPNGSMVVGNYYVDKDRGDVWSATAECEEISSPALRKLQAKVRLRIGLSDSEYHKIKRKGPLCS